MAQLGIKTPNPMGGTRRVTSLWWRGSGKFAIAGLVLAAIIIGAWSVWQNSREQHLVSAAENYLAFIKRLEEGKDIGKVVGIPELPSQGYSDTSYLAFAYLRRSKFFIDNEDYEKAEADLRWVAENSVPSYLSELAYVRLVRILIVLNKSEEALKILDEVEFSDSSRTMVEDVRGDVLLSLEDFKGAVKAYSSAWKNSTISKPELLRVKLQLLGQVPK